MIAADVNNRDGWNRIFLSVLRQTRQATCLFQNNQGQFESSNVKLFKKSQVRRKCLASLMQIQDGDLDLYVVSGGYHSSDPVELQDRLYFNDGKGVFNKAGHSIPQENIAVLSLYLSISMVTGTWIFIGNRMTSGRTH